MEQWGKLFEVEIYAMQVRSVVWRWRQWFCLTIHGKTLKFSTDPRFPGRWGGIYHWMTWILIWYEIPALCGWVVYDWGFEHGGHGFGRKAMRHKY